MAASLTRKLLNITGTVAAVPLVAATLFYVRVIHYDFPDPKPFSGNSWYNPYTQVDDSLITANFHAHARCWWGLTNGADDEASLVEAYKAEGYQLPGISNYHQIGRYHADDPMYVPIYEHGLNLHKVHCLAINAREVSFSIFPWLFNWHQKQQQISTVNNVASLVALAHPEPNRYRKREMRRLGGYQLMEVGNTLNISTSQWDAALSAGKLSWIISDDDTHSMAKEQTFKRWTCLYVKEPTRNGILEALQAGRTYGVASYDLDCEDNRIGELTIIGDTLQLIMSDTANRIDLVGQDGIQKATSARSDRLTYLLQPGDTYLRTEVHGDHCVMYLNPVIRFNGERLPWSRIPPINWTLTWMSRIACMLLIFGVLSFVYRMWK